MFTPVDLETMVFDEFRGYKTSEVQEFMRKLIVDYENYIKKILTSGRVGSARKIY